MADKGPLWDSIVHKHKLHPTRLNDVALWPYGDYLLRPEWEIHSSMDKARALGFGEALDTGTMFARHFAHYRARGLFLRRQLLFFRHDDFVRHRYRLSALELTVARNQVRHEPDSKKRHHHKDNDHCAVAEALLRSLFGFEIVREPPDFTQGDLVDRALNVGVKRVSIDVRFAIHRRLQADSNQRPSLAAMACYVVIIMDQGFRAFRAFPFFDSG